MSRQFIFPLALSIALACWGCGSPEAEKQAAAPVSVTLAQKGTISHIVSVGALVFPLKQATVSPKISSTVTEFKVQRGSRVKKGQLLAILENKDLAAQVEASKGDFEQADANYILAVNAGLPRQLQKAKLDAATAKLEFEATQKIYDSRADLYRQGAIPRRDLDSADLALLQARSQNEQAQKQLTDLQSLGKQQMMRSAEGTKASAEGHYRAATTQLGYSEIRSPIDGVVTDRPLYVGDVAAANQPILTVMDISKVIAKAHVPQSEALLLRIGDVAEIEIPGVEGVVKARVSLVSPALDLGSTTIEVWFETDDSSTQIKPGMSVNAEIAAKTVKNAVTVPSSAVFRNSEGEDYLLLAGPDHKAHQRMVEVGVRNSDLVQIAKGLAVGEPVISSGGYGLTDGAEISAPGLPSRQDKIDGKKPTANSSEQVRN